MTSGTGLLPGSPQISGPARTATRTETKQLGALTLLILCAAHVGLAFVLERFSIVATAHALVVLLVGLWLAIGDRQPQRILYLCAYVVGAELLWRVTHAGVFWEYSKYLIILFGWITVLRYDLLNRGRRVYLLFLVLLLPALAVLPYFDRREVAFNLSGPFSLGVMALVFSVVRLDRGQTVKLLAICLVPIVGTTALAANSTLETTGAFIVGSTDTTAGFGPNQVSSVLGLGMFIAFLLVFLIPPADRALRLIFVVLASWIGIQCLLTFSRGGMWGGLAAVVVASWFLLRHRRARRAFVATCVIVLPTLFYFVVPAIDDFTGGVALNRFQETGLTGRDRLMRADLMAFRDHPILGVGPGQSMAYHAMTFRRTASHTEYTRLLAEHGLLGLWAVLLILQVAFQRVSKRGSSLKKSLRVSLTAWTLLYLGHSAMRLAAPGFIFALAGARFLLDETDDRQP